MKISPAGVWLHRAARARIALLAVSSTVLVLSATLTLSVAAIELSGRTGVRHALADPDAAVSLTATIAADPSGQDSAIRRQIAVAFGDAPVSVTRADVTADSEGEARARWVIAPAAARIDVSDLGALESGFRRIAHRIESTPSTQTSSVQSTGSGLATVIATRRALAAIGTITPVPLVLLALAGLIALVLARSVLTDVRANETRLLRSRGGSVRGIVLIDLRESLAVCLAGAVVGTAAGWFAALAWYSSPPSAVAVFVPATGVFVGSVLLNLTLSWRAARSASGAPRSGAGRRRALASAAALAFGLAITSLSIWRFEVGASVAQDPLAVIAPAMIVLAAVVVCLALASWSAVRTERRRARRPTAGRLVPLRDVNRRVPLLAGPTALLAIAVAVSTLAATYSATWTRYENDSRQLALGAPLRATLSGSAVISDGADLAPIEDIRSVPGVTVAVPVSAEVDQYSDSDVAVVGVSAAALSQFLASSTVIDAAALTTMLGTYSPRGLELPKDTRSVEIAVSAAAHRPTVAGHAHPTSEPDRATASVWLSDRLGDLVPLELAPVAVTFDSDAPPTTTTADLPPGGPWTIVAMDVNLQAPQPASDFSFWVTRVTAVTDAGATPVGLPSASWTALDSVFDDGLTQPLGGQKLGFARAVIPPTALGGLAVRLMPQESSPVPVVISRPFARAHNLRLGDGIDLEGPWASFHGEVRGVVDLVPGATSGDSLIADLPAVNDGRLRASEQLEAIHEIWIGVDETRRPSAQLAAAIPAARFTRVPSAGSDFTAVASTALWIGAGGAIVFAWIALTAVASTLLRRRSEESRMLRALGVRAGTQGRWRRAELLGTAAAGLIAGIVAGIVASAIVVTSLARLATTGAPLFLPARLQVDPVPIVIATAITMAGAILLVVVYGRFVERGSR